MQTSVRRRGPLLVVGMLAVVALVASGVVWRSHDDGSGAIATGPAGEAFYSASAQQLSAGRHGSLVWSREVDPQVEGGRTHLVLYRSTDAKGDPVAVSGTVSLPPGTAPAGGWPVVSWGHGTTGMADQCAPTRTEIDASTGQRTKDADGTTTHLLDEGYAVVRTDYEGLGTPGPHPYLMGQSEGASMADIVLAAHELVPDLSPRWVAMGHSQGGQAALFTSRFDGAYTPGLDLLGVVSLAPPSQLGPVIDMLATPPSPGTDAPVVATDPASSAALLGPLVVGAAHASGVPVADVVSPRGRARLPDLEDRCVYDLLDQDSLGGLGIREFVRDGADLSRIRRTVGTNDAAELVPLVPVLLVQGSDDEVVDPGLTDRLAEQYRVRDVDLEYLELSGADHMRMLERSRERVDTWVKARFAAAAG